MFIVDRNRKRELEGIISLARDTIQEREQEKQGLDAQDQELQDQKRQLDDDEVSIFISGWIWDKANKVLRKRSIAP